MSIYKEKLLDEYKNPRNYGIMSSYTTRYTAKNEVCGDEITTYLRIEGDIIEDVKFTGSGCAISQAAASLITDYIKGKEIREVCEITEDEIKELLGVDINPMRMKCAMLVVKSLIKSIIEYNKGNDVKGDDNAIG